VEKGKGRTAKIPGSMSTYTDEIRLQVWAGTDWRWKVRQQLGPESAYENKNLQLSFIGDPHSIGPWAVISYGDHTPLIPLRKRIETEKKSEKDKYL
jgi:hypothetical protein